jgi:hypothetical protein
MKKMFYVFTLGMAMSASLMSFQIKNSEPTNDLTVSASTSGYIDVYFENKCSKNITLKIQGDGSASSGTLYAGKSERKPVKAGYKIYADDKLVVEISDSHSGKTIVVCD